ncbi:hypothetical protein O9993_08530 [Vibrio lentus]|nr:hypothetical protein [Vibrio lentus]
MAKTNSYFVPLASGIAVRARCWSWCCLSLVFYGKRLLMGLRCTTTAINLDSMLVEDLTSIAEPGVEAVYLHRMGVDCGAIYRW